MQLNVAIVGAGLMGRWHAYSARRLGSRVIAIVDRDSHAAERLAHGAGQAATYPDMQAMLGARVPDIVHLCTPVQSHLALGRLALESGAHAIVEKPLADTADDAQRLHAAAQAGNRLLCPVHQFAFQRGVARAVALLAKFGEPLRADFNIASAGAAGRPDDELDSILTEIIPHPFSLLRRLWPGISLNPGGWTIERPRAGELLILGDYGGIAVTSYLSLCSRPTRCMLTIQCTLGTIHVNLFHGFAFGETGAVSRAQKIAQPFVFAAKSLGMGTVNLASRATRRQPAYPGLQELIRAFYMAVACGGTCPISTQDSLAVAVARDRIAAALTSARDREQGRP